MNEYFSPENLQEVFNNLLTSFLAVLPPILLTLIGFWIANKLIKSALKRLQDRLMNRVEKKAKDGRLPREAQKRIATLFAIFENTIFVVLLVVLGMVILSICGVEIGPILAAAGVLGLAVSFGAQSLVKDIIAGTFILLENQIRIGDVAIVDGTGGLVEEINLRTVVLRDLEGTVHVFPNGTISRLSNMTKDWSFFVIDMGVAYKEDPDHVMQVMKRVADSMRQEDAWKTKILDDMELLGVNKFADSAVEIKARIKTTPIDQWSTGREYRKRLKKAFDEEGIEIPFPHRSLYFGEASKAFELAMLSSNDKAHLKIDAPKDSGGKE